MIVHLLMVGNSLTKDMDLRDAVHHSSTSKMGNIAPKVEIELTPLAFQSSVITITPAGFLDATILPVPTCQSTSLPGNSVQTISTVLGTLEFVKCSSNAHNYIDIENTLTYTPLYRYYNFISRPPP